MVFISTAIDCVERCRSYTDGISFADFESDLKAQDAVISNNLKFSKTVLTKAISKLVKKGMIRRWSTNAGFVYILAEEKPVIKSGKKK